MKKCPRCNQVFFDDNQNFCLNDGETLVISNNSQPTLVVDPKLFPQTSTPVKQGVSPVFAYLLVGLICLLIGGSIAALFLFNPFSKPTSEQANALSQKGIESAPATNKTTENQQPSVTYQPTQTPLIVKVPVPVSQSKTKGYKNYTGTIGDNSASFDLVWNNDRTISGSYYLTSNPNVIYTVSGSNYVEGSSEIRVSQGSNFIGQIRLSKTIEGNILCWQGNFSNGNQYVRFCRKR